MGAVLSCCLAQAACCCAGKALSCCCCSIPYSKLFSARFLYAFGFFMTGIFALIMFLWGGKMVEPLPGNILTDTCPGGCFQFFSVYKICLGMVVYHAFWMLLLFGARSEVDPRSYLHFRFWPLKVIVWLTVFIGFFFVPSEVLPGFWIASLIFSIIYMIIQAILLVGIAHDIAEKLMELYEVTENSFYQWALVILTVLFNGLTLAGIIVFYVKVEKPLDLAMVTVHLCLVVIQTVMSILPKVQELNPGSGLLQPALVSLYMTYMVGSTGLHGQLKITTSTSNGSTWTMYVGLILTFMSIAYTASSSGASSNEMGLGGSESKKLEEGKEEENLGNEGNTEYNYSFFHGIFILASFYMALVITGWQQPSFTPGFSIKFHDASYWIEIVCSWLVSGLYMFSLVAPAVFPDREFGYSQ